MTVPPDLTNIGGGEFSIAGLGEISNSALRLSKDVSSKVEVWRFFFTDSDTSNTTGAEFDAPGSVTVTFAAGAWNSATLHEPRLRPSSSPCSARPPTSSARTSRRSARASSTTAATSTSASSCPAGKTLDRSTVTDLDPEFTINSGLGFAIDSTQAPLFLREDGNTVFFRFWTRGAYTTGAVTVTFLNESFGFTDGTLSSATGSTTPTDFTVGGVATPNITYIDIQLGATAGDTLDASSIEDAQAEFTLTGTGVGTAQLIDALAADPPRGHLGLPLLRRRHASSPASSRSRSSPTDSRRTLIPNLAEVESFMVGELTGELGDPSVGSVVGTDVLNGRGFFDVTFTVPTYASGIDFASVTDLDPEFTVSAPAGIAMDASRAPVYLGSPAAGQHKFRYFYTGAKTGTATLNLIGNGLLFTNAAGQTVPLFAPIAVRVVADGTKKVVDIPFGTFANLNFSDIAATDITSTGLTFAKLTTTAHPSGIVRFEITAGTAKIGDTITVTYSGSWTYGATAAVITNTSSATLGAGSFIEVVFNPIGATGLSLASIIDTQAEIALSGTGLGNVALDTTAARRPDLLSDGKTVRYYLTGDFVAGDVQVDFLAGTWTDTAGDTGVASSHSFKVIDVLQDESSNPAPDKVFFIDLSGGMELRLADLTPEPLFEIRGKVSLEIGRNSATNKTRFLLAASGTIKVFRLGNLASAAAKFVLEVGDDFADIEFWGVAAFQTNFEFLEQYGIYLTGSVLLQVNTTQRTISETISLEGIPGGRLFVRDAASAPALPTGTFAQSPLAQGWIDLLKTMPTDRNLDGTVDSDPRPEITFSSGQKFKLQGITGAIDLTEAGAMIEGVVAGKKWKITTTIGKTFFIEKETLLKPDGTTLEVYVVRSEDRTYDLLPRSLAFEIVGGLRIQPDGADDPWFQMAGGFYLRITPTRFEFFVTAAVSTSIGLSGRAIGLFIIQTDVRRDDQGNELDPDGAIPGIAGHLSLEITVGDEPDGADTGGISNIEDVFSFTGEVQIVFNTTLEQQTFAGAGVLPGRAARRLPDRDPHLRVGAEPGGQRRGDPVRHGRRLHQGARPGADHALQLDHPDRLPGLHQAGRRDQLHQGRRCRERQRRPPGIALRHALARLLHRHRPGRG